MRRTIVPSPLVVVVVVALAVLAVLTVAVTSNPSLGFDSRAFQIARDARAPWLDDAARAVTTLGLLAVVGPAVALGAALLFMRGYRARAGALVAGAGLAWIGVWILKWAVDRPRPPAPLVHTVGQSYPSGHAANSVGWLALAIGLAVIVPTRGGRIAAIALGASVAVLVGLTRIYLRAHYASDVLAGEALAVAMYALASIATALWWGRRRSAIRAEAPASPRAGIT